MAEARFTYPGLEAQQCTAFERFAEVLQADAQIHNLTSVTETGQVHVRHFADSLQILPILDRIGQSGAFMDVGSGAGLPGLAVAIARPAWRVHDIEATGKKVRFQHQVIRALDLSNATVVQARAEDLAHDVLVRERFEIVAARAVASLNSLVELCIGYVRVGGLFVAFKGPAIEEELYQAQSAMSILGCQVEEVRQYSLNHLARLVGMPAPDPDVMMHLVILRKTTPTPTRYPRGFAAISKRPL